MSMEANKDVSIIKDEDVLRKMWQETEDFGKKKEIRAHMYKLREERLKNFYDAEEVKNTTFHTSYSVSEQQQQQQRKETSGKSHTEALADHSFIGMKSKEVRDSVSPTKEIRYTSVPANADAGDWTIVKKKEVSDDGRSQKQVHLGSMSATRQQDNAISSCSATFENVDFSSEKGDQNNFTKTTGSSTKSATQQHIVEKGDNSMFQSSSTSSSSSSRVVSSSSNQTTSGDAVTLPDFRDNASRVTSESYIKPDGTKVTTETFYQPDGTKVTKTKYEKTQGRVTTTQKSEGYASTNVEKKTEKKVVSSSNIVDQRSITQQKTAATNQKATGDILVDQQRLVDQRTGVNVTQKAISEQKLVDQKSSTVNVSVDRKLSSDVIVDRKNIVDRREIVANNEIMRPDQGKLNLESQIVRSSDFKVDTSGNKIDVNIQRQNIYDKVGGSQDITHDIHKTEYVTTTKDVSDIRTADTNDILNASTVTNKTIIKDRNATPGRQIPIEQFLDSPTAAKPESICSTPSEPPSTPLSFKPKTEPYVDSPTTGKPKLETIYSVPAESVDTLTQQQPIATPKMERPYPTSARPTDTPIDKSQQPTTVDKNQQPTETTTRTNEQVVQSKKVETIESTKAVTSQYDTTYKTDYCSNRISVEASPSHQYFASTLRSVSPDRNKKKSGSLKSSTSSLRSSSSPEKSSPERKYHPTSRESSPTKAYRPESRTIDRHHKVITSTDIRHKKVTDSSSDTRRRTVTTDQNLGVKPRSRSVSPSTTTTSDFEFIRTSTDQNEDVQLTKLQHSDVIDRRPSSLEVTTKTTKKSKKVDERSSSTPLSDFPKRSNISPTSPTKRPETTDKSALRRKDTYEERCKEILGISEKKTKKIERTPSEKQFLPSSPQDRTPDKKAPQRGSTTRPEKSPQSVHSPTKDKPEKSTLRQTSPSKMTEYPPQVKQSPSKSLERKTSTTSTKYEVARKDTTKKKEIETQEFLDHLRHTEEVDIRRQQETNRISPTRERPKTEKEVPDFTRRSPVKQTRENVEITSTTTLIGEKDIIRESPGQVRKSPVKEPYGGPKGRRPESPISKKIDKTDIQEFPSQIRRTPARETSQPENKSPERKTASPTRRRSEIEEFPSQIRKSPTKEPYDRPGARRPESPIQKKKGETDIQEFPSQIRRTPARDTDKPQKKSPERETVSPTRRTEIEKFPSQTRKSPTKEPYGRPESPRPESPLPKKKDKTGIQESPSQIRRTPVKETDKPEKKSPERESPSSERRPKIEEFPSQTRKSPTKEPYGRPEDRRPESPIPNKKDKTDIHEFPSQIRRTPAKEIDDKPERKSPERRTSFPSKGRPDIQEFPNQIRQSPARETDRKTPRPESPSKQPHRESEFRKTTIDGRDKIILSGAQVTDISRTDSIKTKTNKFLLDARDTETVAREDKLVHSPEKKQVERIDIEEKVVITRGGTADRPRKTKKSPAKDRPATDDESTSEEETCETEVTELTETQDSISIVEESEKQKNVIHSGVESISSEIRRKQVQEMYQIDDSTKQDRRPSSSKGTPQNVTPIKKPTIADTPSTRKGPIRENETDVQYQISDDEVIQSKTAVIKKVTDDSDTETYETTTHVRTSPDRSKPVKLDKLTPTRPAAPCMVPQRTPSKPSSEIARPKNVEEEFDINDEQERTIIQEYPGQVRKSPTKERPSSNKIVDEEDKKIQYEISNDEVITSKTSTTKKLINAKQVIKDSGIDIQRTTTSVKKSPEKDKPVKLDKLTPIQPVIPSKGPEKTPAKGPVSETTRKTKKVDEIDIHDEQKRITVQEHPSQVRKSPTKETPSPKKTIDKEDDEEIQYEILDDEIIKSRSSTTKKVTDSQQVIRDSGIDMHKTVTSVRTSPEKDKPVKQDKLTPIQSFAPSKGPERIPSKKPTSEITKKVKKPEEETDADDEQEKTTISEYPSQVQKLPTKEVASPKKPVDKDVEQIQYQISDEEIISSRISATKKVTDSKQVVRDSDINIQSAITSVKASPEKGKPNKLTSSKPSKVPEKTPCKAPVKETTKAKEVLDTEERERTIIQEYPSQVRKLPAKHAPETQIQRPKDHTTEVTKTLIENQSIQYQVTEDKESRDILKENDISQTEFIEQHYVNEALSEFPSQIRKSPEKEIREKPKEIVPKKETIPKKESPSQLQEHPTQVRPSSRDTIKDVTLETTRKQVQKGKTDFSVVSKTDESLQITEFPSQIKKSPVKEVREKPKDRSPEKRKHPQLKEYPSQIKPSTQKSPKKDTSKPLVPEVEKRPRYPKEPVEDEETEEQIVKKTEIRRVEHHLVPQKDKPKARRPLVTSEIIKTPSKTPTSPSQARKSVKESPKKRKPESVQKTEDEIIAVSIGKLDYKNQKSVEEPKVTKKFISVLCREEEVDRANIKKQKGKEKSVEDLESEIVSNEDTEQHNETFINREIYDTTIKERKTNDRFNEKGINKTTKIKETYNKPLTKKEVDRKTKAKIPARKDDTPSKLIILTTKEVPTKNIRISEVVRDKNEKNKKDYISLTEITKKVPARTEKITKVVHIPTYSVTTKTKTVTKDVISTSVPKKSPTKKTPTEVTTRKHYIPKKPGVEDIDVEIIVKPYTKPKQPEIPQIKTRHVVTAILPVPPPGKRQRSKVTSQSKETIKTEIKAKISSPYRPQKVKPTESLFPHDAKRPVQNGYHEPYHRTPSPTARKTLPSEKKTKETEKNTCITTKSIILNDDLEDEKEVIINLQRSKSSREATPDHTTVYPCDDDDGVPRYPDQISEPDDTKYRSQPINLSQIIIDEDREMGESKIEEIVTGHVEVSKIRSNVNKVEETDECLLSVNEKVSKFVNEAQKLIKPTQKTEPLSKVSLTDLDVERGAKHDERYSTVSEKVNRFINAETSEHISKVDEKFRVKENASDVFLQHESTDRPTSLQKLPSEPIKQKPRAKEQSPRREKSPRVDEQTPVSLNKLPTLSKHEKENISGDGPAKEPFATPKSSRKGSSDEPKSVLSPTGRLRSNESIRKAKQIFESFGNVSKDETKVSISTKKLQEKRKPTDDITKPIEGGSSPEKSPVMKSVRLFKKEGKTTKEETVKDFKTEHLRDSLEDLRVETHVRTSTPDFMKPLHCLRHSTPSPERRPTSPQKESEPRRSEIPSPERKTVVSSQKEMYETTTGRVQSSSHLRPKSPSPVRRITTTHTETTSYQKYPEKQKSPSPERKPTTFAQEPPVYQRIYREKDQSLSPERPRSPSHKTPQRQTSPFSERRQYTREKQESEKSFRVETSSTTGEAHSAKSHVEYLRKSFETPKESTKPMHEDKDLPGYMRQLNRQPKKYKSDDETKTSHFGATVRKHSEEREITSNTDRKAVSNATWVIDQKIEDIYDLELLESLLERTTEYELRSRIRNQIRLVKRLIAENKISHYVTTVTRTVKGEEDFEHGQVEDVSYKETVKATREQSAKTLQSSSKSPDRRSPEKVQTTKSVFKTELKKTKPGPKAVSEEKPSWVTQKNLKNVKEQIVSSEKVSSSSTTRKSERSSPRKEIVVESSHNDSPSFGGKAFGSEDGYETSYKVQGTVVKSHYYSQNGEEPVGEISITKYSSDPNDFEGNGEVFANGDVVSVTTTRKFGDNQHGTLEDDDKEQNEFERIEEATSKSKTSTFTRKGSVKEISKKFIENAVQACKNEKQTSYPKAGLILRSSSFKDSNKKQSATSKDVRPSRDVSTKVVTVEKRIVKGGKGDSSNTFLTNQSKVTGVQDVITRIRNAETEDELETKEDTEARMLLNKFIGCQVLLSGMESSSASSSSASRTTTIKRTITKGGKPITEELTFTHPVTEKDLETIWDIEILKLLLERSTDFEEQQTIQARLSQVMAEQEDGKADSVTQETEAENKEETADTNTEVKSSNSNEDTSDNKKVLSDRKDLQKTVDEASKTRTASPSKKPLSPFAKFRQLDRQSSGSSPSTPNTPTGTRPLFKFTDPDVSKKASTIKERLLQWVQMKTKEYENISIDNFSSSWADGLAFCALIHHFLPDAFDYSALSPKNRRHNFTLAFKVAEEKADIYPLLDVEDMVMMAKPDWKCVFTYVQAIYRRFKDED